MYATYTLNTVHTKT